MTAGAILRRARKEAGLTLRQLARLAETSHSTLAAYESGAKTPRFDTLQRVVRAAGFALDFRLAPRADNGAERAAKGRELSDLLDLVAALPAREPGDLRFPRFPTRPR
ncbi:MAG: helix-turn-helix transcriptional regulator [Actinobacteria bacterium]|nr:helix-turn-helix transcriptional regulator [Actinomycetota bacterium]